MSGTKRVYLDEVDLLVSSGESVHQIAARIGVTTEAIARAYARAGNTLAARPFWAAYKRDRKSA